MILGQGDDKTRFKKLGKSGSQDWIRVSTLVMFFKIINFHNISVMQLILNFSIYLVKIGILSFSLNTINCLGILNTFQLTLFKIKCWTKCASVIFYTE